MKFSLLIGPLGLLGVAYSVPVASNNVTSLQMESMLIISEHFRNLETSDLPKNATEDGLSGSCKPITMIFAKGTGENGNVGDGSSPGPALIAQVRKIHGTENVAVQGVAYVADVKGQANRILFLCDLDIMTDSELLDICLEEMPKEVNFF